jgi:hypothetical protein
MLYERFGCCLMLSVVYLLLAACLRKLFALAACWRTSVHAQHRYSPLLPRQRIGPGDLPPDSMCKVTKFKYGRGI